MATFEPQALAPGSRVDGFVVDRAVVRTADTWLYRVRDAESDAVFLLREYAPAYLAKRGVEGSIAPAVESAAGELSRGIAGFLAEAARASTLHHATLLRSLRAFRANGTACELLVHPPGRMLSERLDDGVPLNADETARIARALLDALEFLHARQRLHGALGPGQVLVTETGALLAGPPVGAGVARDEGTAGNGADPYAPIEQAEATGGPRGDASGRRSGGQSAGQDGGQSDGQSDGQRAAIGPWTDIYRLAATLFHCATGAPPPPAVERRSALRRGEPDPLPAWSDTSKGDAVGAELRTLIERGLKLEPGARPQSLREWRARVADFGAGAGEGTPSDEVRRARPGRIAALSAGLVLLVLLIGGLYVFSVDRDGGLDRPAQSGVERAQSAIEAERWRQALETDAVVGYRKFIEDFPDSPRVAQAREYIERLETQAWPAVLEEDTRAAYEAHLEAFPDGRYATEALARIEAFRQEEARQSREAAERDRQDNAAWAAAQAAGTVAALDEYLAAWPGGAHVMEARELRQALLIDRNEAARFEEARAADTIAAYRGYIADFPAGRHVEEAMAAIDRLTLRPGKTFRDCSGCPEMVVVPAGSFWQGSADASPLAISLEKPRRRVAIGEPFAIGVREVTMRQWDACVEAGGCERQPGDNGWGRGKRPAIGVSWNDAVQYAEWLSRHTGQDYALPSESEWEYAARAGEESDWLGGSAEAICEYGNIAGTETAFDWRHPHCADRMALSTAIAGSFEPNAFGLYDVIGNVAEWTLDCMNLSYLEAPTDGSAWTRGLCSSRMTRGGSWFSGTRDVRLPARFNLKAGDRNDFTGFRVVRRVEPQGD